MRSTDLHFQFFMIYSGAITQCKCANSVVNTKYGIRNTQIKKDFGGYLKIKTSSRLMHALLLYIASN